MSLRASLAFLLLLASALRMAAAPSEAFAAAQNLFEQKRYPEARAALEQVAAAEPKNALAFHLLGRCWVLRHDEAAVETGLKALARAVELEPENPIFLGIYGGNLLQAATRNTSLTAATKGRDAMEKAVKIDPAYLDAHEGLFQFYDRAPWPLGSSAKASAHLEEIRKRDPDRATVLGVMTKVRAKEFGAAFTLCENVLAKKPDNYIALYQYGRTAAESGQKLEPGLKALQKCLALEPPSPASPQHTHVWQRIGNLHEKTGRPAEARKAYETSLKLDPTNRQATEALAKLK